MAGPTRRQLDDLAPAEQRRIVAWSLDLYRAIVHARVLAQWQQLCAAHSDALDSLFANYDDMLLRGACLIADLRACETPQQQQEQQDAATVVHAYIEHCVQLVRQKLAQRHLALHCDRHATAHTDSTTNSHTRTASAAAVPLHYADDTTVLETLNQVFFDVEGFRGNQLNYYSETNSFLDCVIASRNGLPITLCLVRVISFL